MIDPAGVEGSVPERFARVARANRGRLAVEDDRVRLTYGALERRANGIARAVLEGGGGPAAPVVLMLRQGAGSVAATLGALGAGAPFVPLEPSDPPALLTGIADRLDAPLVVTDAESAPEAAALGGTGRRILLIDDVPDAAAAPGVPLGPDAVACVYFTSGTTGGPKGVMDTHRNLLHNAMRYTTALGIGPSDRLSLLQSPSFSGAASSTFGALLNGAALMPMRASDGRLADLAAAIRERRITIYHSVPSILRSLLAVDAGAFPDVRVVRLEGDRASAHDVELHRRRFGPGSILANGFGTTETGLCRQLRLATTDPVPAGILPIGYPVPDMEVRIVDEDGRALSPGKVGEIAVSSRYLALGYWRRPDLTEAAFRPDAVDPRRRVYRTGDLGRFEPDGCLAFLGRRDGELKVDGQRVEPAEVEAHLLSLPGVVEAAVTTYPGRRGEGRLAAYLVVDGTGPDHLALRERLAAMVPAAMVPATLMFVEALPLTDSGKLDRAALRPPVPRSAARAPSDEEAALIALWEQVLERRGIGVDDDFLSLGGDSLAAAELLAALEDRAGRPLPDGFLVRAPTVARMAAILRGDRGAPAAAGIVPLQPLGSGVPLVMTHGTDFSTNTYAWLVRALGMGRPIWGLDAPPRSTAPLGELADAHAAALLAARPEGPHLLAGFCSGGVVALEVARRLRERGAEVGLLALIGVGASDFPGLLPPEAVARQSATLPRTPVRRRVSRAIRRGDTTRTLMRGYAPARLPGAATLYLPARAVALYSDDPAADWAGLADRPDVVLLAGDDGDLLHEPVVGELARAIADAMASAER